MRCFLPSKCSAVAGQMDPPRVRTQGEIKILKVKKKTKCHLSSLLGLKSPSKYKNKLK